MNDTNNKRSPLLSTDDFCGCIKRHTKGRQPRLTKVDQRFTNGLVTKWTKGRQPSF